MMEDFDKYINRNKNINRGYRKLEVWKEAIELFALVKNKLASCDTISFKTKAQIEDSALSVPSNIAEGYSRRHLKENIQFNTISLSSLSENYSQIFALVVSKDIDKPWFDYYDSKHYSIENKLINLNKTLVSKLKYGTDWKNDYIIRELIELYNNEES